LASSLQSHRRLFLLTFVPASIFSRVLPKSLPKSVLGPWRAVLTAGFPKVWANIPRLLVDPFVLESGSFAPFDRGRKTAISENVIMSFIVLRKRIFLET
jgi:hypothetical protein